jgi:hypothetical protein
MADVKLTVKLTKDGSAHLSRFAKAAGMSMGDMVGWLVRETSTPKLQRRNREPRSEEVALTLTETDAAALKAKCREIEGTAAQLVDAYVAQVST